MSTSPLSPWVYLTRNVRRVLPILGIQMLVTMLLIAIITPTNAFRATSEAYLSSLDHFTAVTPAQRSEFDDTLFQVLDDNPAMERRIPAKTFRMQTPMIVGKGMAPLIALEPTDQQEFLDRLGLVVARGSLPKPDTNHAAIHEAVLRARGLDIGDVFGRLVDPTDRTPGRFKITGALSGDSRLGLVDFGWATKAFSVLARTDPFQVVYATPSRKEQSDTYLREAKDAEGRRVFHTYDAKLARREMDENLANLALIVGFISISVAVVVALVTALLSVISFQSRIEEFGLHLALGRRRGTLVRKLVTETSIIAIVGWLLGLGLGLVLLWIYKSLALDPKGIRMIVADPRPILFSLSVPILSAAVSALALTSRLRKMDPVAVLQRRGV